jgi:hypothetical protein
VIIVVIWPRPGWRWKVIVIRRYFCFNRTVGALYCIEKTCSASCFLLVPISFSLTFLDVLETGGGCLVAVIPPTKMLRVLLPLLDFDSFCYVLSLSCYFPGAIDPSRQSRRHTWRLPRGARPNPTYTLRLLSRFYSLTSKDARSQTMWAHGASFIFPPCSM